MESIPPITQESSGIPWTFWKHQVPIRQPSMPVSGAWSPCTGSTCYPPHNGSGKKMPQEIGMKRIPVLKGGMTIPKINQNKEFRPWHIYFTTFLLKATPNLMMVISSVLTQVRSGHPNKIATSNDQHPDIPAKKNPTCRSLLRRLIVFQVGRNTKTWVVAAVARWICDKNTKFMQKCLVTHDDNI